MSFEDFEKQKAQDAREETKFTPEEHRFGEEINDMREEIRGATRYFGEQFTDELAHVLPAARINGGKVATGWQGHEATGWREVNKETALAKFDQDLAELTAKMADIRKRAEEALDAALARNETSSEQSA